MPLASPFLSLLVAGAAPADVPVSAGATDSAAVARAVPVATDADWNAFCLRRAVGAWENGDVKSAVSALDARDPEGPADPRADFLLAWGRRALGDREGFRRATEELGMQLDGDAWAALARMLSRLDALSSGMSDPDVAGDLAGDGADRMLAFELLVRDGRAREALALIEGGTQLPDAVVDALTARAHEAAGQDANGDLRSLVKRHPSDDLERDLVAAARLRLSGDLLAEGRDPGSLLDFEGSERFESAARHARALAAHEHGDSVATRQELEILLHDDPGYERRREVAVTLGFLAAREGRWEDARLALSQAEAAWEKNDRELAELADDDAALDRAWREWTRTGDGATILLDAEPVEESFRSIANHARDLRVPPENDPVPTRFFLPDRPDVPAGLTPPMSAERLAISQHMATLATARTEWQVALRELAAAEADANRLATYLDRGVTEVVDEGRKLDASIARMNALIARADEIVARLDSVRDEEMRRIVVRTARFLRDARDNLVLARSIQRFRIEGPGASRPEKFPEGVPTPAEILMADAELVSVFESWIQTFGELAPGLVERSHREIWVPRATQGARDLEAAGTRQIAWLRDIERQIRNGRLAANDPARFASLQERIRAAKDRVHALEIELATARREIVKGHVASARAQLAVDHERLAYGLAVATHELAMATSHDTDDPGRLRAARRLLDDAHDRYLAFLDRHPDSRTRSEVQFRLADALMSVARDDFHLQMQKFLGDGGDVSAGRALAPFVDYGPALAIYQNLLVEDPGFAHRDAVLFHVGMILSDDGDPAARGHLLELVNTFPGSVHAQEAHLRLGDDYFQNKNFAACLEHYEAAAAGSDPEHAAIALYKAGWAHFNVDEFDDSALSFRRLIDLYASSEGAASTADLREEAERHLVEALARAGGAPAFARLFDRDGGRAYEPEVLDDLGVLLRRFSLFEEAVGADSLWLARWPDSPGALDAATRMVKTVERVDDADGARESWLALAPRFRRDSAWWNANESDSLRAAGDEFARGAYRASALHHHQLAQNSDAPTEWTDALSLYEELVAGWPAHAATPTHHYYAGEAAAALHRYPTALDHFARAAASDTASFRTDAEWQGVAVRDAWYESTRPAGESAVGADSLATPLLAAIDSFTSRWPQDERVGDLLWRKANVAWSHDWKQIAADGWETFLAAEPGDERAVPASRLRAQALYDLEDFPGAAIAYQQAFEIAQVAGADSVAAEIAPLVPHCRFREAERVATVAGRDGRESAPLFEEVAEKWPDWEHSQTALYRAGLGWAADGLAADAVRSWTHLAERYPDGEYTRDATLEIAHTWEKAERPAAAARAYERFSETFPADADADAALLQAVDLYAKADEPVEAERLRTRYLERFPDDTENVLAILHDRATKELASAGPDRPLSSLLAAAPAAAGAAGKTAAGTSSLSRYLELAGEHGELADRGLLAEVAFRQAEETREDYARVRITLPLEPSIAQKKSLLENTLQAYQECAAFGVTPWNRASATRIGETLVAFGDALMASERPADLSGDDLLAYDEVLEEQSWQFYDRGEGAWAELIRQTTAEGSDDDEWTAHAKRLLWPRVAARFVHRPEVEYPLIAATPPTSEPKREQP
ncbi:MAG: outer membrane protein assembly factor BamD [bacterium]